MPDYSYSYNLPSFQSMLGASPVDILGLLQGYKTAQTAQQIAGEKELAGMGYDTQKKLAEMGYGSARELAGLGYKSAADLQREQLAKQELLARLGYGSQRELQTLAGNQAIQQMQTQSDLGRQQGGIDLSRQLALAALADATNRRKQSERFGESYYMPDWMRAGTFIPTTSMRRG